jgi:hypothetical protein
MKQTIPFLLLACVAGCEGDSKSKVTDRRIAALARRLSEVEAALAQRDARLAQLERSSAQKTHALQAALDELQGLAELLPFVRVEDDSIIFEGANIHIRNATGETNSVDGTGNLIMGHNEPRADGDVVRTGSHNVVVGPGHSYASYCSYVGGKENSTTGPYSTVLTGTNNEATGRAAVVVAGTQNAATGLDDVVVTGYRNRAEGNMGLVGTGSENTNSGSLSAIVTGQRTELNQDSVVIAGPDPL